MSVWLWLLLCLPSAFSRCLITLPLSLATALPFFLATALAAALTTALTAALATALAAASGTVHMRSDQLAGWAELLVPLYLAGRECRANRRSSGLSLICR